ncbi:MAG: hypothetical protein IJV39_03810 [Ruminococcus sp.]|nr:hypothetical protein [Ruminococcus sp.]MBQ9673732.1 hypothetical protein [Ruminococcus sp.]
MFNSNAGMFKGICIGVASGIAMGMFGEKLVSGGMKTPIKKKMNKALHAVGEVVDTASYMFK